MAIAVKLGKFRGKNGGKLKFSTAVQRSTLYKISKVPEGRGCAREGEAI